MKLKLKIIVAAVAIILVSANTWALDDTPANRSREVDRYLTKKPLQERLQQTIDQLAQALPIGSRKKFKDLMIINIDIPTIETAMKDSMINNFTADELKALADSDATSVGESLSKKFELDVMTIVVGREMNKAILAKISPYIVKAVLNDGRLRIRVKDQYSAIAAKDIKTQYEMESPAIRRNVTFEEWKKSMRLDDPQQQSTPKIVQGELLEICSCFLWSSKDGLQTLGCWLSVRLTTEDGEGHQKSDRFLEVWLSANGEWYHGFSDTIGLKDCR